MGRDSGTRLYSCPVPDSACGSRQDTLLPDPHTHHGEEEAAQELSEQQCPQPVWGPHPVPPQRGRSTQGTCSDPQPCSLRPHRLSLLYEAPRCRGDGHSCPHPAHSRDLPCSSSRKGWRGGDGDGTAGSHQLSTFAALASPVTPGSSHACSHPPPLPAPAPGTRPNSQQRGWKKKSSKRLTVFQSHHKTFLTL